MNNSKQYVTDQVNKLKNTLALQHVKSFILDGVLKYGWQIIVSQ